MPQPVRNRSFCRRLVEQAIDALYHEQEDEALGLLTEVLRRDPEDLRAHYLAALCSHLLNQEQMLERVCANAFRLNRGNVYTQACDGIRYLYLANDSRAGQLLEQAAANLPEAVELHVGLALVHEHAGEYDKAVAAWERVLELDPDNVRALVAIGALLAMEGDFETALANYTRARRADPETENPHQRLGRDYYCEGMLEQAGSEFALAVDAEPSEPAAWFYLLDTLCRLDRSDAALDVYEEIRRRFGDDAELVSGFYEHFNMKGEARRALRRLVAQRPDDADALAQLSRACRDVGRTGEATRLAERAVRLDHDHPQLAALLGELYFDSGRYARAAACCRRAVQLDPNAHESWVRLADALLFLGKLDESVGTARELERIRREAWEDYQARFSGRDRTEYPHDTA